MASIDSFEFAALGLSDPDIPSVARRQLIGSVVAAVVIAIIAALASLPSAHREAKIAPHHRFAGIQQPSFVTPPNQRLAAVPQNQIELP